MHCSRLNLFYGFVRFTLHGWDYCWGFVFCLAGIILAVSCFALLGLVLWFCMSRGCFLFRVYAYFVAERFVVWYASWLRCFLRFCVLRDLDCIVVSYASWLGLCFAVLYLSWLNLFWGFVRFVAGVNLRFCALRGLYFVRCFVHL